MKKLITLLISIIFVQLLIAQNPQTIHSSDKGGIVSEVYQYKNNNHHPENYYAQLSPTVQFQGEGVQVAPQEGKTETENVWVNRGLWIAVIVILIVVYISRRKKQ